MDELKRVIITKW